jgi:hypothetical protein
MGISGGSTAGAAFPLPPQPGKDAMAHSAIAKNKSGTCFERRAVIFMRLNLTARRAERQSPESQKWAETFEWK